ncbi:MAG: ATP-binding protein [Ferruginibacter sp.]
MSLSVKNKIWLGTLFLFLLLLIIGGVSIYYMAKIKAEGKNILNENYESLSYGHTMQQQLNTFEIDYEGALRQFEKALQQQEMNVTEPGELQPTKSLRLYFDQFKKGDTTGKNIKNMRAELQSILNLHMQAIQGKNSKAERIAEDAFTLIIAIAVIVFIISFTFILNFPSIVTRPINHLSSAIKEISNKNYKHRVHIDNKDEFGMLANAFNEMAERLEYFESSNLNKLLFEKRRAEAVINSLKDASIGIDDSGQVLFANPQALQLLGLKKEDIISLQVKDLKVRNELFRFLLENESTSPFKIVIDNRENYFVKEMIEVEQWEVKNKVIVLKNITSYKELDEAKTNFIATISHELKTPLASSDLSLKLLDDERIGKLSNEQKELIVSLKQDNLRMLKILSELLNMSQVEAGRIQLNLKLISPKEIIENAMQTVATAAKEKMILLKNISGDNLPMIEADEDKTTWVINNFLSNAIKYSYNDSTIELSANVVNGKIVFLVKDFGPGIATEYLPRLFERYFQVPGSKEKGSGLGLAISREIIEAQKGSIWVESEIGRGSTFYFHLPIKK